MSLIFAEGAIHDLRERRQDFVHDLWHGISCVNSTILRDRWHSHIRDLFSDALETSLLGSVLKDLFLPFHHELCSSFMMAFRTFLG